MRYSDQRPVRISSQDNAFETNYGAFPWEEAVAKYKIAAWGGLVVLNKPITTK
jgi:hypothetical protein